ncbi:DUF4148 domain-containing protein [Trinickia caryophylli]|uniref:DUF4148 domain-containing protein n=1 Tax=Trinickia caryophylli TaxID=28094 RepID=A0A1X7GJV9_TRICW|nr:DUF4148 domain-containing protein [Trinickia caryophylli]PMS09897.1 DUF4148 domain-containing protein [Trinickia caryophylli]TRX14933.1 DUF4148 domain-containing protein [Trinickia caryophylli]WQE14787.1 DUF4148 domain-containing protein [Trinickia caryophylli]SMF70438.1 protein of unknown function [Trinickia caryophylli]GLU34987.1 hypothetical protein Busp01_48290 [Trinickia caryophylli]
MKAIVKASLFATLLAAPLFAFAQNTDGGLTRAQVRADLVRVESAGYRPIASDASYPADIESAEAKVAAANGTLATASVGGSDENGGAQAGHAAQPVARLRSLYAGH